MVKIPENQPDWAKAEPFPPIDTPNQRIEYIGEMPFRAQIYAGRNTKNGNWIAYVRFQDFRFNISPGSRPWTIGFSIQDGLDRDKVFERAVRYHEELVHLMKVSVTNLKTAPPTENTIPESL